MLEPLCDKVLSSVAMVIEKVCPEQKNIFAGLAKYEQ